MQRTQICLICCKTIFLPRNNNDKSSNGTDNYKFFKLLKLLRRYFETEFYSVKKTFGSTTNQSDCLFFECCDSCSEVVEIISTLIENIKCLQLKLEWRLDTLISIMKLGGKVASRQTTLRGLLDSFNENNLITGDGGQVKEETVAYKDVLRCRRGIIRKCSMNRVNAFPKVVLKRLKLTSSSSSPSSLVDGGLMDSWTTTKMKNENFENQELLMSFIIVILVGFHDSKNNPLFTPEAARTFDQTGVIDFSKGIILHDDDDEIAITEIATRKNRQPETTAVIFAPVKSDVEFDFNLGVKMEQSDFVRENETPPREEIEESVLVDRVPSPVPKIISTTSLKLEPNSTGVIMLQQGQEILEAMYDECDDDADLNQTDPLNPDPMECDTDNCDGDSSLPTTSMDAHHHGHGHSSSTNSSHSKSEFFKCAICKIEIADKLQLHFLEVHPLLHLISCSVCENPVSFARREDYISHFLILHQDENIPCDICKTKAIKKLSISTVHRLREHYRTRHKISVAPLLKCDVLNCEQEFSTESQLKCHVMNEHTQNSQFLEKLPFSCDLCLKSGDFHFAHCKSQYELDKHFFQNHSTNPNKCARIMCESSFSNTFDLESHEMSEHNPVVCKHCFKEFTFEADLRAHLEQVHERDPETGMFRCFVCGLMLSDMKAVQFNDHRKMHLLIGSKD